MIISINALNLQFTQHQQLKVVKTITQTSSSCTTYDNNTNTGVCAVTDSHTSTQHTPSLLPHPCTNLEMIINISQEEGCVRYGAVRRTVQVQKLSRVQLFKQDFQVSILQVEEVYHE